MDNFFAAWPEVECRHFLTNPHNILEHLDWNSLTILVVLLTVQCVNWHSLDSALRLLYFLVRRYECCIDTHRLLCCRRVDNGRLLLVLNSFVDVHDIKSHKVLQACQRVEHFLLANILRLQHVVLQLFINLRLRHVRRRIRSPYHHCTEATLRKDRTTVPQ